ncbi:MAG: hypothetical protein KIS96_11910 [Bauldia sp.]|nr:hypothetical protein [Bauldia sp.]
MLERITGLERLLVGRWSDDAVSAWAVDGALVWPFLCHALNTVALEHLLLGKRTQIGTGRGRLALHAYRLFGERALVRRSSSGAAKLAGAWEDGDIVVFSSVSAVDPERGLHGLADPLRLALRERGRSSRLLFVDADGARPLALPGARGVRSELAAIRRDAPRRRLAWPLPGAVELAGALGPLLAVPVGSILAWMTRLLDNFVAYRGVLAGRFAAHRPAAIVLTDHGDAFAAAVCAVARAAGVPVYCLQHGALRRADPEHPDHPFPDAHHDVLPQTHLLWRRERLGRNGIAFGPPRLQLALGDEAADAAVAAPPTGGGRPVVVAAPQVVGDLAPIMALIRGLGPVHCIWRPHPFLSAAGRAQVEAAAHAAGTSFAVDHGPLAFSLLVADMLVTGYSAAALEAATLGVPTVFMSPYARWLYDGQIDPELVRHANGPETAPELAATAAPSERLAAFRTDYGGLPGRAADAILAARSGA